MNKKIPTKLGNKQTSKLITQPDQGAKDVWHRSVEVEESSYYWKGDPIVKPGELYTGKAPVIVELFSGCGGTSLGFEMAGYHVALGADILRPAVDTFSTNHPMAATILGDIRQVHANNVVDLIGSNRVDVLIAGVPCQGFSLNNRKRHLDDKRNLLYREFVRFIHELNPRCIILENVSGMRSAGDFRERIEADLSEATGMPVKSELLNALDYGVPQRRQRLVFVGAPNGFDFRSIVKTHGPDTDRPYNTVRDAIGDLPSLQSAEEAFKYQGSPKSDYQRLMRKGVKVNQLTCHRAPKHPEETIERIRNTRPGEPMYPAFKQRIRLDWDLPSPTQVSGGIRPQFQFGHPSDARGLTIRERCRIQSFPDTFVVQGGIVQGRVQTGNAVPPLLAKAIAEALKEYI